MAYVVDIQFFNTFILRSVQKNTVHIEESRIKGGFNEPKALQPKEAESILQIKKEVPY